VKRAIPDERTFEKLLESNVEGHEAGNSQHTAHGGSSERACNPAGSLMMGEAQEFNVSPEAPNSWSIPTAKSVCRYWLNARDVEKAFLFGRKPA
jgi:hypothetical protein